MINKDATPEKQAEQKERQQLELVKALIHKVFVLGDFSYARRATR